MTDITDLERRCFGALRAKDWQNVEELATRAQMSLGTTKMLCGMFMRRHYVVMRGELPRVEFRALKPTGSKLVNPEYREHFAALMAATEPVGREQ